MISQSCCLLLLETGGGGEHSPTLEVSVMWFYSLQLVTTSSCFEVCTARRRTVRYVVTPHQHRAARGTLQCSPGPRDTLLCCSCDNLLHAPLERMRWAASRCLSVREHFLPLCRGALVFVTMYQEIGLWQCPLSWMSSSLMLETWSLLLLMLWLSKLFFASPYAVIEQTLLCLSLNSNMKELAGLFLSSESIWMLTKKLKSWLLQFWHVSVSLNRVAFSISQSPICLCSPGIFVYLH